MPAFTVSATLSPSEGSGRIGGILTITPSDPGITLTYWRPGEAGASGYRHPQRALILDSVQGMVYHCSAWKHEKRVAKFSIHLDWQGVWYERTWHAKIILHQEHPALKQALNAP